jgi:hypothetical protein
VLADLPQAGEFLGIQRPEVRPQVHQPLVVAPGRRLFAVTLRLLRPDHTVTVPHRPSHDAPKVQ